MQPRTCRDPERAAHPAVIGYLPETDGVDLGRVVIICCAAADAQLARIHLRGPAYRPEDYGETWLKVEGNRSPCQYRRGLDVDTDPSVSSPPPGSTPQPTRRLKAAQDCGAGHLDQLGDQAVVRSRRSSSELSVLNWCRRALLVAARTTRSANGSTMITVM